jgi:hypothetical protein
MSEFTDGIKVRIGKLLEREFLLPFLLIIIATAISCVAIAMVKADGVDAMLKVLDTWGQWVSIFAGIAGGSLGINRFLSPKPAAVVSASKQADPPAPGA